MPSTISFGHPNARAAAAIFSDLLAVLLAAPGGLDAPIRHRLKGRVQGFARLVRKSNSGHQIEIAGCDLIGLVLHGCDSLSPDPGLLPRFRYQRTKRTTVPFQGH